MVVRFGFVKPRHHEIRYRQWCGDHLMTPIPSATETHLSQGIAALRGGDRASARGLLLAAARAAPADPQAWLWLAGALDDREQQRYCLERALALDPTLAAARAGLAELARAAAPGQKAEAAPPPPPLVDQVGRPQAPDQQAAPGPLPPPPAPLSPLLTIWARPGPAMRAALAGRSPLETGLLAGVAGVGLLLAWADLRDIGDLLRPAEIGLLALIAGLPMGNALLLIGGVLLRSGGRWVGGVAGAGAVRAALAWAALPSIAGLLIRLAQLALLPGSFSGSPAPPEQALLALICGLAHLGLAIWSLGLSLVGLSVAHRFSIARAAASWLIAALIVVGAAAGTFIGSALLITLRGG